MTPPLFCGEVKFFLSIFLFGFLRGFRSAHGKVALVIIHNRGFADTVYYSVG